jgi:hypothetical protein
MIKMLKNYKTKLVGLVMIMMFICSVIPTGSASEQRKTAINELLVSKSLPELVDILSDNVTEQKKLKAILADPHNMYGYYTKTLGANLTLANFQKLNNVLETQTNKEDYGVFVAYQVNPTIVLTYKGKQGTAQELYESVPHLQDMFKKYENSVKNFAQMDSYNQWLWLNTEDVTDDSVKELYDKADDNLKVQMVNDSYTSFSKLLELKDKDSTWLIANADKIKNDGEEARYNFNHKSTYRYENPNPVMPTDPDPAYANATREDLMNKYNDTYHFLAAFNYIGLALMGTPCALFILSSILYGVGTVISTTGWGAGIGATIMEVATCLVIASLILIPIAAVVLIGLIATVSILLDYYKTLLGLAGINVDDYDWGVDIDSDC